MTRTQPPSRSDEFAAGAALAVVGSVSLLRTGIDETWCRPLPRHAARPEMGRLSR